MDPIKYFLHTFLKSFNIISTIITIVKMFLGSRKNDINQFVTKPFVAAVTFYLKLINFLDYINPPHFFNHSVPNKFLFCLCIVCKLGKFNYVSLWLIFPNKFLRYHCVQLDSL